MIIAVCDDEKILCEKVCCLLEQYRKKNCLSYNLVHFLSGQDLLNYKEDISLVFLDIEMPKMDGMEVARILKQTRKDTVLVFLTSHKEMMQRAFKVKAFRYLIKPVKPNELYECIDDFMEELEATTTILCREGIQKIVHTKHIIYIEAGARNTVVRTEDGSYESKNKMNDWEVVLRDECFFRCHKTYFVNLAYVDEITKEYATLYNQERVAISRRKRKEFELRLFNYLKRKAR